MQPAITSLAAGFTPEVTPDQVHVIYASLDVPEEIRRDLKSQLSTDELARADRFHFDQHRHHFIVARGILRGLLASIIGCEARNLRFTYSEFGKPYLSAPTEFSPLQFNLSHVGDHAIYALAVNRRVGIDIEQIRLDICNDELVEHYFAPGEIKAYRRLRSEDRTVAFFRCWTRKEAYIKARGEGLSLQLDQFEVSFAPEEPAVLRATKPDSDEADRWTLFDIAAPCGHVAALAVEGKDIHVCHSFLSYAAPIGAPEMNDSGRFGRRVAFNHRQ